MNRRTFLVSSAAGSAVLMTAPVLSGCNAATLKSYLNIVLQSAEKILGLSSSSDSWYTALSDAITAFTNTESSWDGSTAVSTVISALDTLEAVLAVIPVTSTYSTLIDLLVTVIETILTTFVSTSTSAVKPQLKAITQKNPHRGQIALRSPHFLQSKIGAYKAQWNDLAAGANLKQAEL